MKYFLYTILAILAFTPLLTWAVPASVDRITDHIEPLIKSDYIKAKYFMASSTATSTLPTVLSSSTVTTNLTVSSLTNGCLQSTSGVVTSTGVACGSGGGGGSNWTIISGGLRTSTSTDFMKASHIIATSTTSSSTFAGNVGIATTTPSHKLTVIGDAYISSGLTLLGALKDSTNATGTAGMILKTNGTSTQWVATSTLGLGNNTFLALTDTPSSYTANRVFFTNSGATAVTNSANLVFDGTRLGVATSTPIVSLDVAGAAAFNNTLALRSNGAEGGQLIINDTGIPTTGESSNSWNIDNTGTAGSGTLRFFRSGSGVRMTMLSTGEIGIATISPTEKLHVAGGLRLTGAFKDSTNATGTLGQILQSTGSATQWVSSSTIGIPSAASTTEWANFYATPSTRITAGDGLAWSGNTLSATNTHNPVTLSGALDYITLVGQDIVRNAIDLATDITGVLGVSNGGTGLSSTGASSTILTTNGTNPAWATGSSLCLAITGSADLCDGSDATGGGGDSVFSRSNGVIYAPTTTDSVVIGATATTTHSKLEVVGTSTATNLVASSSLDIKNNRITEHSAGFLDIQRTGSDFTLTRIRAPKGSSNEATLSLVNDLSSTDAGVDEEFVDFYNEKYTDSRQWGLRQAYSGTGVPKPFVLGFWNTAGNKDAGNSLIILPGHNVGLGMTATNTVSTSSVLHVASSTATFLTKWDSTPGTNLGVFTSGGFLGLGTSTPTSTLSIVGKATNAILQLFTSTLTKIIDISPTGTVTLLGIWDFGGADSVEIPNGTAPTVDAIGEIALDTTDNQLVIATSTASGAPVVIPGTMRMGSFLISSTTMPFASGFVTGKAIPFAINRDGYRVTEIHCDIDGGTSIVINFDNGSGNTSTVTCDTDGASLVGVGSNSTVTAGSVSTSIETGTVTGSPDYLRVSVFGVYTRE